MGALDEAALVYPWSNPGPKVDRLHMQVRALVQQGATQPNDQIFGEIWRLAHEIAGYPVPPVPSKCARVAPAQLSEPWYLLRGTDRGAVRHLAQAWRDKAKKL